MLLDKIRNDMHQAKKDKDLLKSNLLSALYSEIFTVSKSGKEFKEEDEIKIIKKFIKNIDETLALDIPDESRSKLESEKKILEQYLPEQLTRGEIENIVSGLAAEGKVMKDIMAFFKEKYSGHYDGKTVSEIVKAKTS